MIKKKILVIDDDPTLSELLSDHLQVAGYQTIIAADGPSGLAHVQEACPNLVVLDVMMPSLDGWEVCKRIRAQSSIPIILLTAKDEEIDKLHGFRLGVDDFVTKPASFAELTARIGAVLNRVSQSSGPVHTVSTGDVTIDLDQHRVTVSGHDVDLTRTEYRMLETLCQNLNRTVSTEYLIDNVWGPGYEGEAEQVKHFIWALRKKLEMDPGNPKHLLTERGFGYRFE